MPNPKHLIHAHSSVVTEGEPKLPSADRIEYGEIAVNFADGHETLSIKNSNDDIVTFSSDEKLYNIIIENERTIATALNDINDRISDNMDAVDDLETSIENQLEGKLDKMVSITYSSLKSKRDNSQLIPGQMYRITDFVTTTSQTGTESAGHQFDIVVTATGTNTLSENAKAIQHNGNDNYFNNSNLDAWEIKYDINNDAKKYAWADTTNGKGVIYYMKDEWGNECPYDFKNIMFLRFAITAVTDYNDTLLSNFGDTSLRNVIWDGSQPGELRFFPLSYTDQTFSYGDTTRNRKTTFTVDSSPIAPMFTFTTFSDSNGYIDGSSGNYNIFSDSNGKKGGFFNNIIKPYYETFEIEGNTYYRQKLNNNVFYGVLDTKELTFDACRDNLLDINSHDNTFTFSSGNKIGANCNNNIFYDNCSDNNIGNDFQYNLLNSLCQKNTFGNGCHDNRFYKLNFTTIKNTCVANYIYTMYYNTIGNECYSNYILSNDNIHNNIGDEFKKNVIACSGVFSDNIFGTYIDSLEFICKSVSRCTFGSFLEVISTSSENTSLTQCRFGDGLVEIHFVGILTELVDSEIKSNNNFLNIGNSKNNETDQTKYVIIEENVNQSSGFKTIDINGISQTYTTIFTRPLNTDNVIPVT